VLRRVHNELWRIGCWVLAQCEYGFQVAYGLYVGMFCGPLWLLFSFSFSFSCSLLLRYEHLTIESFLMLCFHIDGFLHLTILLVQMVFIAPTPFCSVVCPVDRRRGLHMLRAALLLDLV
jgi:hypothetical protein